MLAMMTEPNSASSRLGTSRSPPTAIVPTAPRRIKPRVKSRLTFSAVAASACVSRSGSIAGRDRAAVDTSIPGLSVAPERSRLRVKCRGAVLRVLPPLQQIQQLAVRRYRFRRVRLAHDILELDFGVA